MLNSAVINLSVIKRNAENVKTALGGKSKLCAVVKADAYGHGAEKVAAALYTVSDCFAVALPEEGVSLRLSGIDKEILVLTPLSAGDEKVCVEYGLTASAACEKDVRRLEKECEAQGKTVNFHIAYNTGMNRYGADGVEEVCSIADEATKCRYAMLTGLYSHYAAPENDVSFYKATEKFVEARDIIKSYDKNATCHISASGGFLRGAHYDMVRIGLLLYGYKPFASDAINVKPAMRVYAPVVAKRTLSVGETALYGETRAEKPERLSLVRYGYADGLPRKRVKGQFGNRCMDVTALTDNDKRFVNVIENAEELSSEYGTITYELLCGAARRAEKIYVT